MKIEIRTLQDTARLAQRLAALLKGRHALITLSVLVLPNTDDVAELFEKIADAQGIHNLKMVSAE